MLNKGSKTDSDKKLIKKMKAISYDEHFTRATDSIDLAKNQKFTDIGDGISKREDNEIKKLAN
jgi:hypothetical protein